MSEQELILAIKNGDRALLGEVYRRHRDQYLIWAASRYNCSSDELKDSYQYAILVLFKNITEGKLVELSSNLKTYIFSVGKNRLLKILSRQKKHHNFVLDIVDDSHESLEAELAFEKDMEVIRSSLNEMGDPCKTLIQLSYLNQKSIPEVTDIMGYKNSDTTKNIKYKCMNRLKKMALKKTAALTG